ncbi:hypothetical protein [Leptospira idonii]|uniref:Porin n=1 Tax=Leptospira idonii TaxID=1193500 RepID=A0A4R9LXI7_9LEPT|nr:hypothetical protein [Leptospira idonii]TGN17091.1 hypothetical protein EHS15_18090 [Leptospira idonii]
MIRKFLFLFIFFSSALHLYAEEVVTTKKEEPDSYYGLKLGAIVTPTFGYRVRDSASGISDTTQSEKTGFSMPWTLLFISKEWEDTGIKVEFWGEVIRSNVLSADTSADSGTKANPYLFAIRRANVQKKWDLGATRHKLIFGMQELPHMFSVWSGYYDWRYMERSPLESMAFSADPVDLGLSYLAEWKSFSAHLAVVNGDGYRSIQNAGGTGYDVIGRVSWEQKWQDDLKTGIHFLGRKGNAFGYSGNECNEAKTKCFPSDNNPNTLLRGDVRLSQEESYAVESNLLWREYINLGLGGMAKKKFGGRYSDAMNPTEFPKNISEKTGRGAYGWIGLGNKMIRIVFRGEIATGGPNQGLRSTESNLQEPWVRYSESATLKTTPVYSDKAYYISRQVYLEYLWSETARLGFGYQEIRSFDSSGAPNKWYIDNFANERTVADYRQQFSTPSPALISEYSRLDRNILVKATMQF